MLILIIYLSKLLMFKMGLLNVQMVTIIWYMLTKICDKVHRLKKFKC